MSEISKNNTGLSGEYFIAAELYRRGWSVGMTIGNAKAVDLFAEKDDKIISVQVKSIFKKKNVGWPIMKNRIKNDCLYPLVELNWRIFNLANRSVVYFIEILQDCESAYFCQHPDK